MRRNLQQRLFNYAPVPFDARQPLVQSLV